MSRSNPLITQKLKDAFQHEKRKKDGAALDLYKDILKLDRNHFQAWFNSGVLYSKWGKPKRSVVCYVRALKQKTDTKLLYNLGVEYFKIKEYDKALKMMEHCIIREARFVSAYLMFAVIADKLFEFEKGIDTLKALLKFSPRHRGACIALIILYTKNQDYDLANDHLEKLHQLGEKEEMLNQLRSRIYLSQGDINASIKVFKVMVKENSEMKRLEKNFQKKISLESKKKMKQKKRLLKNKESKRNQDWLDLSLLSLFEGNSKEAIRYLERAVK